MEALKIAVAGAGLMGSEIALSFAFAGHQVTLIDKDRDTVDRARARLGELLERGIGRKVIDARFQGRHESMCYEADLAAAADADVVIEAVFEQLDVKSAVWAALDAACGDEAIFCTNTSTLPISTLAAQVKPARRSRFIGTHFFSPVTRMKLVEVIPAFQTDQAVIDKAMALCRSADKEPILVKDVAGFAVNRVLHAFLIEAVRLVEEGVASPEDIDTACRLGLGHPIGPFKLMDVTTSRLCEQVQGILHDSYGERFRPRPLLRQRVEAGFVGGRGQPGWLNDN